MITYKLKYIPTYIYYYKKTDIYTEMNTNKYIDIQKCMQAYILTYMHTYIDTQIYSNILAYTDISTAIYIYTQIITNKNTH